MTAVQTPTVIPLRAATTEVQELLKHPLSPAVLELLAPSATIDFTANDGLVPPTITSVWDMLITNIESSTSGACSSKDKYFNIHLKSESGILGMLVNFRNLYVEKMYCIFKDTDGLYFCSPVYQPSDDALSYSNFIEDIIFNTYSYGFATDRLITHLKGVATDPLLKDKVEGLENPPLKDLFTLIFLISEAARFETVRLAITGSLSQLTATPLWEIWRNHKPILNAWDQIRKVEIGKEKPINQMITKAEIKKWNDKNSKSADHNSIQALLESMVVEE